MPVLGRRASCDTGGVGPPFGGGGPPGGCPPGGGPPGGQWGGPRPEPPRNPELRDTIEKLAEHMLRLGPQQGGGMEAKVREAKVDRERDPLFAFLVGGDGADYFRSLLQ